MNVKIACGDRMTLRAQKFSKIKELNVIKFQNKIKEF